MLELVEYSSFTHKKISRLGRWTMFIYAAAWILLIGSSVPAIFLIKDPYVGPVIKWAILASLIIMLAAGACDRLTKTDGWVKRHTKFHSKTPETVALEIKEHVCRTEKTSRGTETTYILSLNPPDWEDNQEEDSLTFYGQEAYNAVAKDAMTANVKFIKYYDRKKRLLKTKYTLLIE